MERDWLIVGKIKAPKKRGRKRDDTPSKGKSARAEYMKHYMRKVYAAKRAGAQ